jgi:hypothetical protein
VTRGTFWDKLVTVVTAAARAACRKKDKGGGARFRHPQILAGQQFHLKQLRHIVNIFRMSNATKAEELRPLFKSKIGLYQPRDPATHI